MPKELQILRGGYIGSDRVPNNNGDALLPEGVQAGEEGVKPTKAELEAQVDRSGVLMPTSFWDRQFADDKPNDSKQEEILMPTTIGFGGEK